MNDSTQINNATIPEDLKAALNYMNNKGISLNDSFDDVTEFLNSGANSDDMSLDVDSDDDSDVVYTDDELTADRDLGDEGLDVTDS